MVILMESGKHRECSKHGFLFSDVEEWRLYSPQYTNSRIWNIVYLVWRWLAGLYFLASIIATGFIPWFEDGSIRAKWFIYLTNWAFLLYCLFQLWAAISSTIQYFRKGGFQATDVRHPAWPLKVYWFLWVISQSSTILVTVLFWGLVYTPGSTVLSYDIIVAHGINTAAVLLIDIWITALPFRVLHFYIPLLFGISYVIFSVIYDHTGGTNYGGDAYIYSAIDWTGSPTWAGVYTVVAVITIVILHFLLFGLYKLKLFIYMRRCNNSIHISTDNQRSIIATHTRIELD